jgi:hypothetical protein
MDEIWPQPTSDAAGISDIASVTMALLRPVRRRQV